MDTQESNYMKGIIEALLFTSDKPVMLEQIKDVIEATDAAQIRETVSALQNEYTEKKSGMVIVEIAGGYQMLSNSEYALYIKKFYHTKHKEKLSKPALETLAIIAYKQPVSRLDIELIRGVNCDGVMFHLLEKELIKIVGRKDVPGRPYIYGTTKQFLEYFGLKSLDDLPKLEDFISMQEASAQPVNPQGAQGENQVVAPTENQGVQEISQAVDSQENHETPKEANNEPSQTA